MTITKRFSLNLFCVLTMTFPLAGYAYARETVFDRIGKLYERGVMPDIKDFDPSQAFRGKSVIAAWPDKVYDRQLISVEQGDEAIGWVRIAALFDLEYGEHKPNTIELGQKCLLGQEDEVKKETGIDADCPAFSPLREDEGENALVEDLLGNAKRCASLERWRKTTVQRGKKVLVVDMASNDDRRECNPGNFGNYKGQSYLRGYVFLP